MHPHIAAEFDPARDIPLISEQLRNGAVAVGECGLDYHYDNSPREAQRAAFAAQMRLAEELDRPLIVHTRDAEDDTAAMIEEARGSVTGVLHCFTGSHSLAERALDAGWYISFSGIVTFKKWSDDALLSLVPADKLLVESDSPYLAPAPNRGKRNEPAWVTATLAKIALARGSDPAALAIATARNASNLFGLADKLRAAS